MIILEFSGKSIPERQIKEFLGKFRTVSYIFAANIANPMKRYVLAALILLVPVIVSAQAQINTKKVKIEDFTEKTTKVVLTGNLFFDTAFKDEIRAGWKISPFEFCTLDEFERIKTDDEYYFLMVVKGQFRKESSPGIEMLSVMKGGEAASKGLNHMLDVVTMPIMSAENPSGREFVFLPALLDILQEHILHSMEKDIVAYSGLANYTMNLSRSDDMDIVFAEDDLAEGMAEEIGKLHSRYGISVVGTDDADEMMINHKPNTLVSFTVCPADAGSGSYCYKMLVNAETHELYYYRKHRITKRFGPGFLMEDISRIISR